MRMTPALHTGWLAHFALLNLSRHVRRTAVALLTIATGFAALSLFAGYTADVYRGMQDQAIYGEMLGHMTLYKTGLREQGRLQPEKWILTTRDIERATAAVRRAHPEARVFARLSMKGLVSNGRVSTIFIAEGIDPQDMRILRGPLADASGALESDKPVGVSLSRGLSSLLSLNEGADLSLLSSTIRGQANALDATVIDTYDTGTLATNDMSIYVPLELGRSLLDAPGQADRLTVVLPDLDQLDEVRARIQAELGKEGLVLTVQPWRDAAVTYRQVKAMFDLIFAFMFAILLALCMMALVNVVGMNVVERSREIGALRALGMRQATTRHLFTVEAMWMVVLGCAVGLALTLLLRAGINSAHLGFTPPNSTDRVPLTIGIDPLRMALIAAAFAVGGTLSAWFTARRAARRPIIDALGHV
jgi:putative ABC transport system permease protein